MTGELQASDEPVEPEWGNPRPGRAGGSGAECIGAPRGTGGTETSQYLEEAESRRESRSSGERTGMSPNQRGRRKLPALGL